MSERRRRPNPASDDLDVDLEPDLTTAAFPPLWHVFVVLAGGFLGTLARYAVVFHHPAPPHGIDTSVILINVSGAFVLGILATTLFQRRPDATSVRLFLTTGILGGWTTYSAIIAGSITLGHHHALGAAVLNLAIELVAPVAGALLGGLLGSAFLKEAV